MAIIKKFSPKENLNTFSTFVTDTNPNSDYFRITEFKETFTGGRNGFLIEGSEHLKETTEIKIEILDVNGDPLYFEPGDGIPEYYEGVSKLIAVYVYNDTPIGQAKITVLGELKTYLEGGVVRDIPDDWKGVYNAKWERTFKVNKLLANEDRVRFYRRPKVDIEEIVKPIFNTSIPTVVQSGSVNGIPNVPLQNQTLTNYTQPTSYRLEIVGDGAWTGSVIGTTLEFGGIRYSPTVVDIVNSKNIIVNPPYSVNNIVNSFTNEDYTASFQYVEGVVNGDSPLSGSFAKINITDLKTFVGDVARVKVFRKSKSNIGDFEFVQEIQLESNEILVDFNTVGKNEEFYGLFTDINIDEYWITSSNDITATFNQSYLYNSTKLDSNVGVQNFYTSNSLSLQEGVEYTLSFGVRSGLVSSPNYIQAFITGSRQSTLNGSPVTVQVREDIVKINSTNFTLQKQDISRNFIAEKIDDAKLYFEVVGTDWYINNVSLRASQETSFSPDEITFIQPVPKTLQDETFDYKFEFYDINNNTIPVTVLKTERFVGGNTALLNRSLVVEPTNLFFTFDSASQSVGVNPINFEIIRNLLTGSVTFTSGAFDVTGSLIPSSSYVGQYPGLLTSVSDTSATLTAANFTGSDATYTVQYIIYTASCENLTDTVTIGRVSDGANGLSAGKFEATTEVFVKRFDDTFTPTSSSITASFFERNDVSNPITASLIVYPSHSFDLSDNDVSHLYYETGSIDNSIVLVVRDGSGVLFESGKENARVTELINLDFTFTGENGASTNLNKTLNISTDGELGTSPITVEVAPPTFVFIADESGNILNYDDLTTTISVYEGTTKLPLSISPAPGTYTGSTFIPTNITISDISGIVDDITVGQFSNIIGNSANVVYNLVVYPTTSSIYKTESINVEFTQNLSVVKGGRNARSVNLSADTYIVVYDGDDNIVFPPSETVQLQSQALNHTGSVYYQFSKNNVTQSQSQLQNTYELSSGVDIVGAGETDVWSVVTRESEAGPIVAVDSISIAGVKSGKDSRSVSLVASSNFVNYDGTGSESPSDQEIVLTATPFNHTGSVLYEFKSGSTTIQSGSANTYIISSSYTQSVAPNIPIKPLFNETQIYSVLTREGNLATSILSADAITIGGIKAGTDSEEYAIVPLNGTAIKNSDPSKVLEIKATYQGQDLTTGSYKLAILSASLYEPLSAASASGFILGVNSGSIAGIDYNATFTSQSISGSLNVFLVSGSSLVGVEDSITLADISDGLGGGFVEASTLTFIRDKNNIYTPTTSSVTASFYQRGTFTNPFTASLIVHPIFDGLDKMKYVTASVSPFIEIQVDDQDGNLVESDVTSSTKDLNFIFKFVDPTSGQVTSVTETFFIISDGLDGVTGINAKLLDISVSSPAFSFASASDTLATPLFITASIKQQNLSSTILTSDISITGSDDSNITVPSLSGTIVSGTGTQTFIISFADSGAGGLSGDKGKLPLTINVVKDGILETTTILKLEGGADGSNGADAYTVNLSNEAVTLPTTVAGIVSPSGSGTTINVLKGTTPLTAFNGTPGTGQFNVTIASNSTHITPGIITHTATTASVEDIGSWADTFISSGSIVYAINAEDLYTFFKTQSFALSYEGKTGPGIVFRGFWTGSIAYQYDIDSRRRDAVLYNSGSTGEGVITYYATLQPSGPSPNQITPTGSVSSSQYWEELGVEDFFVAAKIAIFEQSFVKNTLNVGNNPGNPKANIVIQGSGSLPYIAVGQTGSVIGYEQPGIFMGVGVDGADRQFLSIVNDDNSNYLKWDGDNLKIKGNIEFGSSAPGQNIIQLDWKYKEAPIETSAYNNIASFIGSASENAISYSLDPFGNRSLTWDCYSGDDASAPETGNVNAFDGGFLTNLFPIDSGSSYKYVVYVKPTNTTGFPLFGTTGYDTPTAPSATEILSGSTGVVNTNPYFRGFIGIPEPETGSWQVLIGYVHSNSTPNTELTYGKFKGGAYSVETGNKLLELEDYKWGPNAKYSNLRIFHYADLVESGIQMQIWGPAVYKIDGTEPSDATLIDKAKAIADGKYSGGTFISADTIFSPTIAGIDGRFSGSVVVGHDGQGVTLDGVNKKIYIGSGNYANQNTPFYVASGSTDVFSLGNRLSFNGSQLNITGSIVATDGRISGEVSVGPSGEGVVLDGSGRRIYIGSGSYNNQNTPFYVASGSNIFSLGDKLTFDGSSLSVNGTINAIAGNFGGMTIELDRIKSVSGSIEINGEGEYIHIFDSSGSRRFDANSNTALSTLGGTSNIISKNITTTQNITLTRTVTTTNGTQTDADNATLTVSSSNFTPEVEDGEYDITYIRPSLSNGISAQVTRFGNPSINWDNFASASLSLTFKLVKVSDNSVIYTESDDYTIFAALSDFQSETLQPIPSRTIKTTLSLISGSEYKFVLDFSADVGVFVTATDGDTFNISATATVDYNTPDELGTVTVSNVSNFTEVNGGGFQSIVGAGQYMRVAPTTFAFGTPTTRFGGSVMIENPSPSASFGLDYRYLKFQPKGNESQYWIVNTEGDIAAVDGTVGRKSGLMFGTGDRASSASTAANNLMLLTSDGNIFLRGTLTPTGNPSDINLKTEISTLEHPLNKIGQMGGYSYIWGTNSLTPGREDAGVVAQEVEMVLPQVVRSTKIDGVEYKTVNYDGIVALLVEAVKELTKEVNNMKDEINLLKQSK